LASSTVPKSQIKKNPSPPGGAVTTVLRNIGLIVKSLNALFGKSEGFFKVTF